jgi:hypothetical protein
MLRFRGNGLNSSSEEPICNYQSFILVAFGLASMVEKILMKVNSFGSISIILTQMGSISYRYTAIFRDLQYLYDTVPVGPTGIGMRVSRERVLVNFWRKKMTMVGN